MNATLKKVGLSAAIGAPTALFFGGIASATADSAAVDAVGDAGETLKDTMVGVGTRVLPYAAAVLVLSAGWRLAKRFVS